MLSLICLYFFPFLTLANAEPVLTEYQSFSHFDLAKYTKADARSFDSSGIITQKKEYHPLTISIYGIMNYDQFQKTGDSAFYYRAIQQYNYFSDPSHLVFSDSGKSAGLPYHFAFKDMKAPWISGMTQGTAVSYLLRYYALTKNESALDLSRKLIHLMLQTEAEGGTIGRSKEGGPWIEEYPGSKKAKSVLNGFVNGLIGLHEYCLMFPDDKKALALRDSCYNEMINNVHRYDSWSWTAYSRSGVPISTHYLRYQLEEFDHLYTLFGDERLRNQMRIWSRTGLNKPDTTTKFYLMPNYQFSMMPPGNPISDSCVLKNDESFSLGMRTETASSSKRQIVLYNFDGPRYYCEVKIAQCDSACIKETAFVAKYKDEEIILSRSISADHIVLESQRPFDELIVKFTSKKKRESSVVTLKTYDHKQSPLPLFAFYNIFKVETIEKGKTCYFNYNGFNLTNATVFYRFAQPNMNLSQQKYTIQQSFLLNGGYFIAPETGQYQFFISYDLMHPVSAISKLNFKTLK